MPDHMRQMRDLILAAFADISEPPLPPRRCRTAAVSGQDQTA
jgi:hypothetical protein